MRRDLRTALSGISGEAEVVRSLSTAVLGWPVCLQKADVRWRRCTNGGLYVDRLVCASLLLVLLLVHSSTAEKSERVAAADLIGNNNEKCP